MAERKEAKAEKEEAEKYQKLVKEYVSVFITFFYRICLQTNAFNARKHRCKKLDGSIYLEVGTLSFYFERLHVQASTRPSKFFSLVRFI